MTFVDYTYIYIYMTSVEHHGRCAQQMDANKHGLLVRQLACVAGQAGLRVARTRVACTSRGAGHAQTGPSSYTGQLPNLQAIFVGIHLLAHIYIYIYI